MTLRSLFSHLVLTVFVASCGSGLETGAKLGTLYTQASLTSSYGNLENIQADQITSSSARLFWTSSAMVSDVNIVVQHKRRSDVDYSNTIELSGLATEMNLPGLDVYTEYDVRFRLKTPSGESLWTDPPLRFITGQNNITGLKAPSLSTPNVASVSLVSLSWSYDGAAIDHFVVTRTKQGTLAQTSTINLAPSHLSFEDVGSNAASGGLGLLIPAAQYVYKVSAVNAAGISMSSEEKLVTMPDGPLSAPTDIVTTANLFKEIKISWAASPDTRTTHYVIKRGTSTANLVDLAEVSATATSYSDLFPTITSSVAFQYQVIAKGLNSQSQVIYSLGTGIAPGTALLASGNKLATPSITSVNRYSRDVGGHIIYCVTVTFSWTPGAGQAPSNVSEYQIYSRVTGGIRNAFTTKATPGTTAENCSLPQSATTYFSVQAKSSNQSNFDHSLISAEQ